MPAYILPFEKMHGLGNDFVVIHYRHLPENINVQELAKTLCDRHFSIGGDGIIIAHPGQEGADFSWEYINSDGSYGEMCGNGIRCYAKYLFDRGIAKSRQFTVHTRAGIITPEICDNSLIKVDMGEPNIDNNLLSVQSLDRTFSIQNINMGNPHAIIWLESLEEWQTINWQAYGKDLESNKIFPDKSNIEFAYLDQATQEIYLNVWERGAGYTLACGTGACATVMSSVLQYPDIIKYNQDITVHLPGGDLIINKPEDNKSIYMTGSATSVFIGQIELTL